MIVKFKTQYAYSIDKVNVISSNAGDVADLDCALANNLINKGVCELNTYTPVEETKVSCDCNTGDHHTANCIWGTETKVIIPEIKEKPKRKKRTNKVK